MEKLEYNYDKKLTDKEYEILSKFINIFREQKFIIADKFRQDYTMIPLENERIIFKVNNDTFKDIKFRRKVPYKGKNYIVSLNFWKNSNIENGPKCLTINELKIQDGNKVHSISLNTDNSYKKECLYNIIDIFNEDKILSPEKAYAKRFYTNTNLQKFIENHEWNKIDNGLMKSPELINALFIMKEAEISNTNYEVVFGSILYQLINFREKNINELSKFDLRDLDLLILKLSKSELLKVKLIDNNTSVRTLPAESILLESNNKASGFHASEQFTLENNSLCSEGNILKNCIKPLKK